MLKQIYGIRIPSLHIINLFVYLLYTTFSANTFAEPNWATQQATALSQRGDRFVKQGDFDQAIASVQEAIRFDATYEPAYLLLASIYVSRGNYTEAEKVFTIALEHIPRSWEVSLRLGSLLTKTKRWPEAINHFYVAASLHPSRETLEPLVKTYVALKQYPAALAIARQWEEMDRSSPAILNVRALTALVAETDPVYAGSSERGPVRRTIATSMMSRN